MGGPGSEVQRQNAVGSVVDKLKSDKNAFSGFRSGIEGTKGNNRAELSAGSPSSLDYGDGPVKSPAVPSVTRSSSLTKTAREYNSDQTNKSDVSYSNRDSVSAAEKAKNGVASSTVNVNLDKREQGRSGRTELFDFSVTRNGDISTVVIDKTSFTYDHNRKEIKLKLNTDVTFEFDKANINHAAGKSLDQFAGQLKGVVDYLKKAGVDVPTIRIDGFTDNKGEPSHNIPLSQRRAEAVQSYLEAKLPGVDFVAKGHGQEFAAIFAKGTDNPEQRAMDRCVKAGVSLGEEHFESLVAFMKSRTELTLESTPKPKITPQIEKSVDQIKPFPADYIRGPSSYFAPTPDQVWQRRIESLENVTDKLLVSADGKKIYEVDRHTEGYQLRVYNKPSDGTLPTQKDQIGAAFFDVQNRQILTSGICSDNREGLPVQFPNNKFHFEGTELGKIERQIAHYHLPEATPEEMKRRDDKWKESLDNKSRLIEFSSYNGQVRTCKDPNIIVKVDQNKDGSFSLYLYKKPTGIIFTPAPDWNNILARFDYSKDGAFVKAQDGSQRASDFSRDTIEKLWGSY